MSDMRLAIIVQEALAIPAQERVTFATSACAGDNVLLEKVKAELRSFSLKELRTAGAFRLYNAAMQNTEQTASNDPTPALDNYSIGALIGSGGFGEVYAAKQLLPVERTVAIKFLRHSTNQLTIQARFGQESQALARLNHPNIATVFDAGVTSDGRSYLVMEFVQGVAITSFIEQQHISLHQRLSLFVELCAAIQHAHNNGVVHRDLKPSNILVTQSPEKAIVKVIDFGIAKMFTEDDEEESNLTKQGDLLGTPLYMSPEQIGAIGSHVDARTDVYSLGVLLYRLLTGRQPFNTETADLGLMSLWRYANGDADLPKASESAIDPGVSPASLRGDLDCITAMAMARHSRERYPTPDALATDIRRHMQNQPVAASPPALLYRLKKFARRQRLPLSAAALVLFSLVGALVQTTFDRNRANQARAELERVAQFQAEMLRGLDAHQAGLKMFKSLSLHASRDQDPEALAGVLKNVNLTDVARDVLDDNILNAAVQSLENSFANEPFVESTLRESLGAAYLDLGLYDKAVKLFEQALLLHNDTLEGEIKNEKDERSLALMGQLAYAHESAGRYKVAHQYFQERLEYARTSLPEDHPQTLYAISDLAGVHILLGKFERSEKLQIEAVEAFTRVYGGDHLETVGEVHALATVLHHQGNHEHSLKLREKVLIQREGLLDRYDNDLIVSYIGLGSLLQHMGNYAEAERYMMEALTRREVSLGMSHPKTLSLFNRLARIVLDQGRNEEARSIIEQGLERYDHVTNPWFPPRLLLLNSLGVVLQKEGRHAEAAKLYRSVHELGARYRGADDPETLVALANLGKAQHAMGHLEVAHSSITQSLPGYINIWGQEHPRVGILRTHLGSLLTDMERFDEAARQFELANRALKASFADKDHRSVANLMLRRGELNLARGLSADTDLLQAQEMFLRLELPKPAALLPGFKP